MLIEFSVENYKCFATQQTLNMRPDPDIHALDENLIRTGLTQENGENKDKELVLLPTVAIYGANASGKSNLLEAVILGRPSFEPDIQKAKNTFFKNNSLINLNCQELVFTGEYERKENRLYIQYENTVIMDLIKSIHTPIVDQHTWVDETLTKKNTVYNRTMSNIPIILNMGLSKELTLEESRVILNRDGFCHNIENPALVEDYPNAFVHGRLYYFLNDIIQQSEPNTDGEFDLTTVQHIPLIDTLKDEAKRQKLLSLVRKADFNIEDIKLIRLQTGREKYSLQFKFKGQDEILYFDAQSEGTKRFLLMMPTIVHVLETGAILLADELEQHLHPDLCKEVVKLFNNPETNPHGSQLILTTHNQDLMNSKLMRPDQIYFINKDDKTGASTLCRASDFKKIDWNNRKYKVDALYNDGVFDAKPHTYGLE
jgi:AAA15 family ATPase/GTPase